MEFRVLGPLDVRDDLDIRDDGADRTPGSVNQRRLLAALLIHHPGAVSTGKLMDVLWGDQPPSTALKTFRTYVSRLRTALAPPSPGADHAPAVDGEQAPVIITRSPGYLLVVAPARIDARRFETLFERGRQDVADRPWEALAVLDEALGLWRGAAFAEFAHEEFARGEAARLEELRLAATEERFEAMLGAGQHAQVAAEAGAFGDTHPLRERPRGQLMRALYQDGRQPEALATYQHYRRLLADELGVDPSPQLRDLHRDILQQRHQRSPAVRPPAADSGDHQASGAREGGPGAPAPRGVPVYRTRFVGRERDLAALVAALATTRMLTLVGVGGVGKTRLAAEFALLGEVRTYGRAWWCDLTEVTEDDAVAAALAAAVGAHEQPGRSVEEATAAQLGTTPTVLILNNCEHVAVGVAATVATVLAHATGTTIVATSRVRLGVDGERVHEVAPLPVPDPAGAPGQSPAEVLFRARATAVRPGFAFEPEQAAVVAALCRRLDGLPLAIELAAARMSSLNLLDIGDRLDDRFRLLTSTTPHRSTTERHRSLTKVVDWSYELLTGTERELFARLSVFTGGFTAPAAEAVCAGHGLAEDELLPTLGALVDASMVTVGATTGRVRYHLLETLREYGHQRLREQGDPARWEAAHRDYFLALAESADRRLAGPAEAATVAEVGAELGNLRVMHQRALAIGDVDTALRLSAALSRYAVWRLRDEVFRWAERATELPGACAHPRYPSARGVAAWGAALRGERDAAADMAGQALGLLAVADPRGLRALEVLMHLALWEGRLDDCLAYCDRAAACTDDPAEFFPYTVRMLALAYAGQADRALAVAADLDPLAGRVANPTMSSILAYAVAEAVGDRDPLRAIEHCQRASDLAAPVDNRMLLGVAGVTLASLRARHGDVASALPSFRQMIGHLYEGNDWTHLWTGLRSLVELLARADEHEPAAVLHGAVTGTGTAPPVYGEDAERLDTLARSLTEVIGDAEMASARERGRGMDDHEVVSYALAAIDAVPPPRRGSA